MIGDNGIGPDSDARGTSGALRYVAIGDSIPRGFQLGWPRTGQCDTCGIRIAGVPLRWFDNPNDGYPVYTAAEMGRALGRPVELDTAFTCSGAATTHFWRAGAPTALLRSAFVRTADLVTLTLGANDLMHLWARYLTAASLARPLRRLAARRPVASLLQRLAPEMSDVRNAAAGVEYRLSRIVAWIHERSPATSIILTSYYSGDDFPATRDGFAQPLLEAARHAAQSCDAATFVDLDVLFGDSADRVAQTGPDGLHPSPAMHRRIGRLVAASALKQLAALSVAATLTGSTDRGYGEVLGVERNAPNDPGSFRLPGSGVASRRCEGQNRSPGIGSRMHGT